MEKKATRSIQAKVFFILTLCLLSILVSGCFKAASTEPQQPTVERAPASPTKTPPLPSTATLPPTSPTSDGPTLQPLAQTATSLAATWTATGVNLPTQEPTLPVTQTPSTPTNTLAPGETPPTPTHTLPPTPTGDSLSTTPTQMTIVPPADRCMHTLQAGETLFRLSLEWNTTVETIASLNGIANPDNVPAGTVLRIPECTSEEGGAGQADDVGEDSGLTDDRIYTVQAGDTVYGIARRFNVGVQDLIDANPALQINPNNINVGQELVIP